jgi:hypothetical protein
VDALAAKGAKQLTLAALRDQIHLGMGKVEIHTEPGCQVILDQKVAGIAGTDGLFVLQEVIEGDHELLARRDGYRDAGSKFSLESNEDKQISLPLEWLGGYLSISAEPSNAKIHGVGPLPFDGNSAMSGMMPAGSYVATVSATGYLTQTRTFQIGAGEHHVEAFQLVIDLAAAKANADSGDQASLELLKQALAHGEKIICDVKSTGFNFGTGATLDDGVVAVSKTAVFLNNLSVAPDKIVEVSSNPEQPSNVLVKVAVMNKKGTKENKKSFLFYNHGAAFVIVGNAGSTNIVNVACNGCDNSINVLIALLQSVRGMN